MPRPDWDETKPGTHPALASIKPTPEELAALERQHQEAVSLLNSPGQRYMDSTQQYIAQWDQHERVARASLAIFLDLEKTVENREAKIASTTRALAQACYKLGRFEEVIELLRADHPLSVRSFEVAAALDRPDQLDPHECPREEAETDGVAIELDRRVLEEEMLSPNHGSVVGLWRCQCCGELNGTPETPARQQQLADLRGQARAAIKSGKPIPTHLQAQAFLKK